MSGRSNNPPSETNTEILMLGYLCIKGEESLSEKISVLDRFGLADTDIAKICNVVIGSIRNTRSQSKKTTQPK